ncbi:MAG: hypothetical protein KTR20_00825 [Cellvibrionaceae bacterium]|nr:hypothetical protein [Cellvibrionaceae bacterium]
MKLRMTMKIVLVILSVVIASCANREHMIADPGYSQREYRDIKPTAWANTLTWNQRTRAGSAYRGEAYYHVLGERTVGKLEDHANQLSITDQPAESIQHSIQTSYSVYENQRWERFCGTGKMNSKDWDFIANEGRSNIPEHLANDCLPPAYTRQDYLTTWAAYCAKTPLTQAQSLIKKATIAPPDSCQS